jgi:hypothetical protein
MIDDIAIDFGRWDAYQEEVETELRPGDLMLYGLLNHGGRIKKVGIERATR